MSKPGSRLHRLASRAFHPDTMEHVIGPAIADLEWECTVAPSSRWWRTWVCTRSYLSFWNAVVVHVWTCLIDRSPEAVGRRVWFSATVVGIFVTAVLIAPVWLHSLRSAGRPQTPFDGNIARALPLLIPQATPISIPAGILFGTLWVLRGPASRSIRQTLLVLGVTCSLFSAGMLGWGIPRANQAYRVVVYQRMLGNVSPPTKGANELTWRELRDRINEKDTATARPLRLSYHLRMALVTTPLIFAMLALVLVRGRRRVLSWLLGLLLFVGYYALIDFAPLIEQGTLSPIAVAWMPNLVAVMLLAWATVLRGRSHASTY